MELRDYVAETLVQVCEGVASAMKRLEGQGVIVNPNSTFHSDGQFWIGKNKEHGPVERWVQMIEMNVTTSVTESTEGDGGAKISVGVLSIGGGLKEQGAEQNTNTVKFSIPICLPSTDILSKQ